MQSKMLYSVVGLWKYLQDADNLLYRNGMQRDFITAELNSNTILHGRRYGTQHQFCRCKSSRARHYTTQAINRKKNPPIRTCLIRKENVVSVQRAFRRNLELIFRPITFADVIGSLKRLDKSVKERVQDIHVCPAKGPRMSERLLYVVYGPPTTHHVISFCREALFSEFQKASSFVNDLCSLQINRIGPKSTQFYDDYDDDDDDDEAVS
ncbi:hypothetical protein ANN_04328 [Periplaneta americana]|uniref:Uncharacterized protein n=1 Tax=Periplaneta americana TaxID=6978 RepID=A0ABQ8T8A1_PERAM|nr:hypothetical protein ANN_04328 [Periplaneta americana]